MLGKWWEHQKPTNMVKVILEQNHDQASQVVFS